MMALKPWGGNHANLLHCLRLQRTYQFTGGNYSWLCEALLPVPGREVRAHLGIRTYIQAFLETSSSTPRHTPSRENQKLAGGSAARTVPAGWLLATRLTQVPCSQPPRRDPASPLSWPHCTSLNTHTGMPAAQAYKPPAPSQLIPTTLARRNPRSGRWSDNFAPKISAAPPDRARDRRSQISIAPRRARLLLLTPAGSTALGAGYPAPGAGHCPAAGRARSPRSS